MEPQWMTWAKRVQAIAQAGLAYASNPFDVQRYQALRELAVEMLAAHLEPGDGAEHGRLKLQELLAAETGYPTPKVDVRAAVFRDDRILLVKERSDERWSLPGGWADVGASPGEMAVREVREEAGYAVRPVRLLAVWDNRRHHSRPTPYCVYKICIECTLDGGQGRPDGIETDAVAWYPVSTLPPLSITRITAAQIDRLWQLHQHPDRPPEFD